MNKGARLRRRRYIAQKKLATPKWAVGRTGIGTLYSTARNMRKQGKCAVVDHIVPLNNPIVCGLHCIDNLRIISDMENSKKSNFWWPDSPYEQYELEWLMAHDQGRLI